MRKDGGADIAGGGDSDDIRVRGGARFGGQLLVKGGKKVDTVVVTDVSIRGDSEIKGGSGNDDVTVQFTSLDGGANLVVGGGGHRQHQPGEPDGGDDSGVGADPPPGRRPCGRPSPSSTWAWWAR